MIIKVMVNSLENTVGDFVLLSVLLIGVCFSHSEVSFFTATPFSGELYILLEERVIIKFGVMVCFLN